MKRAFLFLLALALLLSGCGAGGEPAAESAAPTAGVDPASSEEEMFTQRDLDSSYDPDAAVEIRLEGTSAVCGSGAVTISDGGVTVTAGGTYLLSGSLEGTVTVDAGKEDKLRLVLAGADLHSETSAALYIKSAGKVVLTLAEGTENSLCSGGFSAAAEDKIDGALFSKEDLSINGSGSLTVSSPAGHGIVCKDDLVLTGGSVTVEAASHALQAKDSVRIAGASLRLRAGKDGIHAENDEDESLGFVFLSGAALDIDAQGDGISAGSSLQISGGSARIVSGGGSANAAPHSESFGPWGRGFQESPEEETDSTASAKALKAGAGLLLESGDFDLDAADDAVHSNGSVRVEGGRFQIATGDDGFHADETLTVAGGQIDISRSYEGLEALHLEISGGEIRLIASDDGLNAAGGQDGSGFGGPRPGDRFSGPGRGMGGRAGGQQAEGGSSGSILISGGTVDITASGDGLDANGSLQISGGSVTVCGPSQGDTATLDYDTTGAITGGTFIGTGGASMAQSFSAAEQGVVAVSAGPQSAGTAVSLEDADGNVLLSVTPALDYTVVILSAPSLISGQAYTLRIGSQAASVTAF